MQSHPSISQDCLAISTNFSLPNLSFDSPFSPVDDDSHDQESRPDITPTKTNAITNTSRVDMMEFRHSSLDLYTKPDHATISSSSDTSESPSVSLCTSSYPSSASSTESSEDWIFQSLSNLDILAPTVPDLSFSFVPSSNQKPIHEFNSSVIGQHDEHEEINLIGSGESRNLLKPSENNRNSQFVRPAIGDASRRLSSNNFQINSPSFNSIKSGGNINNIKSPLIGASPRMDRVKSNHRFLLSGHNSRNSSYLESQLDFLTQNPPPMFQNNHDELIMLAQLREVQPSQHPVQEGIRSFSKNTDTFHLASRKQPQRRKSTFLRLGNKPTINIHHVSNNQQKKQNDDRQRRFSTSNLLDKANFILFNSTSRQNNFSRSDSDDHGDKLSKAWLDPTLSSNDNAPSTSASHIKPSRSLFNLFSSKLR